MQTRSLHEMMAVQKEELEKKPEPILKRTASSVSCARSLIRKKVLAWFSAFLCPSTFNSLMIPILASAVDPSVQAQVDSLSAKAQTLSAECETLRKSIEDNAKASKEAEDELRQRLSESEKSLAEERELAKNAAEATQVLRENLDAALDSNRWLDKELVSKCTNFVLFRLPPNSLNSFLVSLCRCTVECLGYPASALLSKTHDDLCTDALVTMKCLIGCARIVAEDLDLKDASTCDADTLAGKLSRVPEHITSWQRSSAIGAARQALFMSVAHHPDMDLQAVTGSLPEGADPQEIQKAVLGYDTRIAEMVNHESWYQAHVLPEDEPTSPSNNDEESGSGSSGKAEDDDEATSLGAKDMGSQAGTGTSAP